MSLHQQLLDVVDANDEGGFWLAIVRKVVELHAPEPYVQSPLNRLFVCHGCDMEGRDAEHPDWPCSTIDAIARELGIQTGDARG